MIESVNEDNLSEFENYIKLNPRGSCLQSSLWAHQNPEWHWRAYIRRNEYKRVTGVVSFLVRPIPVLPFQLIYAGRGPLFDVGDYAALKELLDALKLAAKEEMASIVRLDPPVDEADTEVIDILESYDYEILKHKKGPGPFHPCRNWVVGTAKKSFARLQKDFTPRQAQNIRIAQHHEVEIRRGGKAYAAAFGRMIEHAALRDTLVSETVDYYTGLMDTFGNLAKIYLALIDNRPVAGMIMILTGTRYECVARVDMSNPGIHAMSLLQAAVIQAAADAGYDSVSFPEARSGSQDTSHLQDSGFGGREEKLVGEMDWYVRPLLGMFSKIPLRLSAWFEKKAYFLKIR